MGARTLRRIVEPGAYSKRTLEALRVLGHREAQVLTKVGPRVLNGNLHQIDDESEGENSVPFGDLLALDGAGLLIGVGTLIRARMTSKEVDGRHTLILFTPSEWALRVTVLVPQQFDIGIYKVTAVGIQLLRLGRFEPDMPYMHRVVEWIRRSATQGVTSAEMLRLRMRPEKDAYDVIEERAF